MKATSATRRAAYNMATRHFEEQLLLAKHCKACKDAGDKQGVYDFMKAWCEHWDAFNRYSDLCKDCAAGEEVHNNLNYYGYKMAISRRLIFKA